MGQENADTQKGCATALSVRRQFLTPTDPGLILATRMGFYGVQNCTGTGSFVEYFGFPLPVFIRRCAIFIEAVTDAT